MLTSKHRTKNNQANGSNTEATLILCGYSGELANNNNEQIPAEEAENIITCAEIHTDRVIYPQQEVEPEPEKSKHNSFLEAVELPFTTSAITTEFNDKNPTEKS